MDNLHSQRVLLRAAIMRQAVAQGMTTGDAIALVDRLQQGGQIHERAALLDAELERLIAQAVENHAMGIVLLEQDKAAAKQAGVDLNPALVLTAVN